MKNANYPKPNSKKEREFLQLALKAHEEHELCIRELALVPDGDGLARRMRKCSDRHACSKSKCSEACFLGYRPAAIESVRQMIVMHARAGLPGVSLIGAIGECNAPVGELASIHGFEGRKWLQARFDEIEAESRTLAGFGVVNPCLVKPEKGEPQWYLLAYAVLISLDGAEGLGSLPVKLHDGSAIPVIQGDPDDILDWSFLSPLPKGVTLDYSTQEKQPSTSLLEGGLAGEYTLWLDRNRMERRVAFLAGDRAAFFASDAVGKGGAVRSSHAYALTTTCGWRWPPAPPADAPLPLPEPAANTPGSGSATSP